MSTRSRTSPVADKTLRRQIESIKRQKIVNKKVVSLADFRDLRQKIETRTILVVDDAENRLRRSGVDRAAASRGQLVER